MKAGISHALDMKYAWYGLHKTTLNNPRKSFLNDAIAGVSASFLTKATTKINTSLAITWCYSVFR